MTWRRRRGQPSPGWIVTPSSELPDLPGPTPPARSGPAARRLVTVHLIGRPAELTAELLRAVHDAAARHGLTTRIADTAPAGDVVILTVTPTATAHSTETDRT